MQIYADLLIALVDSEAGESCLDLATSCMPVIPIRKIQPDYANTLIDETRDHHLFHFQSVYQLVQGLKRAEELLQIPERFRGVGKSPVYKGRP